MTCLYFQGIGGASGDMILAALMDLGVPRRVIQEPLSALPIGDFHIRTKHIRDLVPAGLRVHVSLPHNHSHAHGAHEHTHEHRSLRDIEKIIRTSKLPATVREQSIAVFQRLANAEAHVHGSTPNEVHFHEVGAVDAIVDIVGACLALHHLGVKEVAVAPLPLGRGIVNCAHGLLPLPAPATVELLKTLPVEIVDETMETVTPTGAAILATWQTCSAPPPGATLKKTGAGYGSHTLKTRPNLLRAFLFDTSSGQQEPTESCVVLECQMDDCHPEWIGDLIPRLLKAGASDAYTTPVFMKKQRQGILLTVLVCHNHAQALQDLIFRETTTFGIRSHQVQRTLLKRRFETLTTPFGNIRIKTGTRHGRDITHAPEYESCVACAKKAGIPLKTVYETACRLMPPKQEKAKNKSARVAQPAKTLATRRPSPHRHNHGHA